MKTVIQSELEKQGKTAYFLHKMVKGNRTNLYEAVKGYARATGPMREKIAAFLGLPVDALFDENGVARKS